MQADALAAAIKAQRKATFAAVAGRVEVCEGRERAIEQSLGRINAAVCATLSARGTGTCSNKLTIFLG
jgi:phage tail sheath gpL-like